MLYPGAALIPLAATVLPSLWRAEDTRPVLSGPEEVARHGRFEVHFTRAGADAPEDDDVDADGVPDLVDVIGEALVQAEVEFLAEGWRALVGDTVGGDAIDVYLKSLPAFGYASPVPGIDGGNSCYLQLERGLTTPGEVAASVAVHELHHCVQFRYTAEAASWVFESAATYEQYTHLQDPLLDYAVGVLYGERLAHPERRLAATDGRFEYAGFLFVKFWAELDAGGAPAAERLPDLWEALAVDPEWTTAYDDEARRVFGRDLPGMFVEHAIWNAFACASDDGEHYLSTSLPCIAEVSVPRTAWDRSASVEIVHDDSPFTAAFFETDAGAVRCEGEGVRAALVDRTDGVRGATALGADGVAMPGRSDTQLLVVAGVGLPLDASCDTTVVAREPAARGCSTAPVATAWWPLVLAGAALRARRGRRA